MADGRMLKKKISTDVHVADLENPWYIILFTWGISHLDIEGRITGDPREYKAIVTPLLDKITKDVALGFFQKGTEIGLIHRYFVDGKWAIQFPGFKKNQTLRPDKEGVSIFPAPPDDGLLPDNSRITPGLLPDNSNPLKRTPNPLNGQQVNTGQNNENVLPADMEGKNDGLKNINDNRILQTTPGLLPDYSGTTPAEVKLSKEKLREKKEKNCASPAPGNGDARPQPPAFSCECFEISHEYLEELSQTFPLLPAEYLTKEFFPRMRNWCLDNRKTPKHLKKFDARGRLKTPRLCFANWLKKEDPVRAECYSISPRATCLPEDPPGILVFNPDCPVCHGDPFKTMGKCKCATQASNQDQRKTEHGTTSQAEAST